MHSCKHATATLSWVVIVESLCLLLTGLSKEKAELETLLLSPNMCLKTGGLPRPKLEDLSASSDKAGASPRSCRLGKLSACLSGSASAC